jgi:biopolymer transport protein ExbD
MGLKKRNKVNAEFSMSSLTDIIFLLLIFFMLTSSLVQINVELPKSDSKTVAPTSIAVMMTKDGGVTFQGKKTNYTRLPGVIRAAVKGSKNKEETTLTIIAEVGVPWERVSKMMTIANDLRLKAIIATQPR